MSSRAKRKNRWKSQTIEFSAAELTIQADGEGVPSFEMTAYNGGALHLGNFPHPAYIAAGGVQIHGNADTIPILRDHDNKRPVGHGTPSVEAASLSVTGKISQVNSDASEIVAAAKNGYAWQASIGGRILDQPRFVKAGKSETVNGRRVTGPAYVVDSFRWTETSVVAIGADSDRATTRIAARDGMSEFDQWLEANDFAADELSDKQQTLLKAQFDAEHKPEIAELEQLKASDLRKEHIAEVAQIKAIDRLARRYEGQVDADTLDKWHNKALTAEVSPEKMELELYRAARPAASGPGQVAYAGGDANTLVAAMCRASGVDDDVTAKHLQAEVGKREAEKAMNDADGYRNFGLHKLVFAVLGAAGKSVAPGSIVEDGVIRQALEVRAHGTGFSTISLPGILSRVANKMMLQAYGEVDMVSTRFAAQTDTTDYKQFDRYRMTESGVFEKVSSATGEIKGATLTEELLQNQVETYGRIYTITRQMLVNDDMGAMNQIPMKLGRMAAHTLEQEALTTLINAPTGASAGSNFFYSTSTKQNHANYFVDAGGLTIDSLKTATINFRKQVDSDQKPILVNPALLLVTPENEVEANKLFTDTQYRLGSSTGANELIDNQWRGRFDPLVSPYLATLGSSPSTTQWYLLPNPSDTAVIQIAYLRGQRTPSIEQSNVDFDTLGVRMRGVFEFGVALWDRRLAVKSDVS